MSKFAVMDVFRTIQGEGLLSGTPAIFVRFAGCNLNCHWCDTEWTVGSYSQTLDELVHDISCAYEGQPLLVFTGGEPSLQLTAELVNAVRPLFQTIAIETNGTRCLGHLELDHITISPKPTEPDSRVVQSWCSEVKYVLAWGDSLPEIPAGLHVRGAKFISPMTDPAAEGVAAFIESNLVWCTSLLARNPSKGWRISVQTHKLLGVK